MLRDMLLSAVCRTAEDGRVKMTTENSKNDAITWSRIHFSGYAGHVTQFSSILTTPCCSVVGLGLG